MSRTALLNTRQGDLFALFASPAAPASPLADLAALGAQHRALLAEAPPPTPIARTEAVESLFFDGPVADSYSADTIAMGGTLRGTFRHAGHEWVKVGGLYAGANREGDKASCYRLAPDDGSAVSYASNDWDAKRGTDLGSYHRMAVKRRGEAMMLLGPCTTFMRAPSLL